MGENTAKNRLLDGHSGVFKIAQENEPRFGRLNANDEECDRVQYRSIANLRHDERFAPTPFAHAETTHDKYEVGGLEIKRNEAPEFALRADRTNYIGTIPRALPLSPFRLEMHTHFYLKNESVSRICSVIGSKLCEFDTDYTFAMDKCKWKVEYRRMNGAQRVIFNIYMYRSGSKEYVLEVQRREGDITALMHMYGELKASFRRYKMLVGKDGAVVAGKRSAPTNSNTRIASSEDTQQSLDAIVGLLDNKFYDVKLQGVYAAISFASTERHHAHVTPLVHRILSCAHSTNADLSKIAYVALSRLCSYPECCENLAHTDDLENVIKHATSKHSTDPEIQRACLQALQYLAASYYQQIMKSKYAAAITTLLNGWQSLQDPRLQKLAYHTLNALPIQIAT